MLQSFAKPFGGPQQTRRHIKTLVENGFDAAMVIDNDKDAHFYNVDIPTILDKDYNASKDDICVIPEGWRRHFISLKDLPAERICFCQNHYYAHRAFSGDESFKTFGVSTVLCCSRQIANHIERYYDVADVCVVPCGVADPGETVHVKTLSIGFMPRKSHMDAGVIQSIFRRKQIGRPPVEWISIDGMSHDDAMRAMRRTTIFLSLSHREGFGLPPIEAMSVRTLVVGFHGGGGLEYATPRNGYWLDEGDLSGCAEALSTAVDLLRRRSGEAADLIDEGVLTAGRFSMDAMQEKLLAFWSERT